MITSTKEMEQNKMSVYKSLDGNTYKSMVEAEPVLMALRKANPEADLMIQMNTRAKKGEGKFTIIERPNHLKEPSEFDGMTLADFVTNWKVGAA